MGHGETRDKELRPALKPAGCSGCPLEYKGQGFAPPVGPENAEILLVGEALGYAEAKAGRPFVGPSGALLDKILRLNGIDRQNVRITNVVSCQPPNDWLDGAPWEYQAVRHCSQYLEPVLDARPKVVVAIGGSATRRLLDLPRSGHVQANWHGSPVLEPKGRFLVVPTFHPAFLLRGNQKLTGVMAFDFQVALKVARGQWQEEPTSLLVDPGVGYFASWVSDYEEACKGDNPPWLAVDIETAQKLEGKDEGELEDKEDIIIRINFACNPDEGLTVPWNEAYIPYIQRLLNTSAPKCFWNARYDVPRLRREGISISGAALDFMWAWHVLQSDLPRGLGFVAPFYSTFGPWKHLSGPDPGRYAAIDAVQTLRVAFGISRDLRAQGMWNTFFNHVYTLDRTVLHPAEEVGLRVDSTRLASFGERLNRESVKLLGTITDLVPTGLGGEKVWVRKPEEEDAHPEERVQLTQICLSCGATDISTKHRCKDKDLKPQVTQAEAKVVRYVKKLPFNPASPLQVLEYFKLKGYKGGRAKKAKTDRLSTDKKTLEALAKSTKDPFFNFLLDFRAVEKIRGTYVEGARARMDLHGRLHSQFLHVPSTGRLSSVDPNLQNVATDRASGEDALAAGFRSCIVPEPGCVLLEADYSAIEAVEVGWFSGDPNYIRLAKLGVHAYLTSHLVGSPADLNWSDEDLGRYFKEIKKKFPKDYDRAKRVVHGTNYGLTPIGMVNNYPELFTRASATKVQGLYFELCPKLPSWQRQVRELAHRQRFLGGTGGQDDPRKWPHPFGYKHWFWSVYVYNSQIGTLRMGPDSKRVVAYYPQSTAAGVLKDAALRSMDQEDSKHYIGDVYFGKTPIRALIHDSILLEVPKSKVDYVLSRIIPAMEQPVRSQPLPAEWGMGDYLRIGVAVKCGEDWLNMQEIERKEIGVASDTGVKEGEKEE